jgi:hypothetical protein
MKTKSRVRHARWKWQKQRHHGFSLPEGLYMALPEELFPQPLSGAGNASERSWFSLFGARASIRTRCVVLKYLPPPPGPVAR